MTKKILSGLLLSAIAATLAFTAQAQLGKATPEELARKGNGPGPVPGAAKANTGTTADIPPSTDPKDFSGTWRGGGGGAPGGAPAGAGGPGGPGGGAPGGAPGGGAPGGAARGGAGGAPPGGGGAPDQNAAVPNGALPDRIICLPQAATQAGGDGPLLIVQTPEQITWAAEEMHTIRRIFLKGEHTKNFKPNYLGEAIGHWEGNTMVVETIGLKSLPAGAKMIERWTKSPDGSSFEMKISNVDADGKPIGNTRTQTVNWRSGEEMLEWICEDYNDEWLPGGADYTDQVKK